MPPRKILRIDELQNAVAGQAEICGRVRDVLQITFGDYQGLYGDSLAEGQDAILGLRDMVKRVVPSLGDDEIASLNTEQAQKILTLAGAGIEAVEKLFPNLVRPEA